MNKQDRIVRLLETLRATHVFSIQAMRQLAKDSTNPAEANKKVDAFIEHLDVLAPGIHALTHISNTDEWRTKALAAIRLASRDEYPRMWRSFAGLGTTVEQEEDGIWSTTLVNMTDDGVETRTILTPNDPREHIDSLLSVAGAI